MGYFENGDYNRLTTSESIIGVVLRMIVSEKVGKLIATLRKTKGLSQEQLAELLHVSAQAVSKWETGKSLPETATLPLLSAALNHSIDSILLPQKLVVLSAIYTDGQHELDVTQLVNQFVASDRLSLIPGGAPLSPLME